MAIVLILFLEEYVAYYVLFVFKGVVSSLEDVFFFSKKLISILKTSVTPLIHHTKDAVFIANMITGLSAYTPQARAKHVCFIPTFTYTTSAAVFSHQCTMAAIQEKNTHLKISATCVL